MRVKLFTLRYSATLGGFDDTPLLRYTADKELLTFREHFFTVSDVPHLTCVLLSSDAIVDPAELAAAARGSARPPGATEDTAGEAAGHGAAGAGTVAAADWAPPDEPAHSRRARSGKGQRRRGAPEPTEGLSEAERLLFNSLREWRLSTAREEGVPPFLVFTNKHLLQIIAARPRSRNALLNLPGIGPGKVKRYGQALLALLAGIDEGGSDPARRDSDPGSTATGPDDGPDDGPRPAAADGGDEGSEPAPAVEAATNDADSSSAADATSTPATEPTTTTVEAPA